MNKELEREWYLLKSYKYKLSKQQYRTLKGQLKAGDVQGFRKGIFTLMKRKIMK